jgi:hypothetical protein
LWRYDLKNNLCGIFIATNCICEVGWCSAKASDWYVGSTCSKCGPILLVIIAKDLMVFSACPDKCFELNHDFLLRILA